MAETHDELARVVRENAGRLAASLMHLLGDFAAAEDLVQDAIETALQRWPDEGIPDRPHSRLLAEDAEWLASSLAWTLPREPEVLGLLALIRLHEARTAARFDPHGQLVLLRDQDRSQWDHDAIHAATQTGPRRVPPPARAVPTAGRDPRVPHRGAALGGHR
jgi:predicted RNA polymerase sigma factor